MMSILRGDARRLPLPDRSVSAIITSGFGKYEAPYYATGRHQGEDALMDLWAGDWYQDGPDVWQREHRFGSMLVSLDELGVYTAYFLWPADANGTLDEQVSGEWSSYREATREAQAALHARIDEWDRAEVACGP